MLKILPQTPVDPKPLQSKIRSWCDHRQMTREDWYVLCIQGMKKLTCKPVSGDTVMRAYNGDASMNIRTIQIFAIIMDVKSISDVIDFA